MHNVFYVFTHSALLHDAAIGFIKETIMFALVAEYSLR